MSCRPRPTHHAGFPSDSALILRPAPGISAAHGSESRGTRATPSPYAEVHFGRVTRGAPRRKKSSQLAACDAPDPPRDALPSSDMTGQCCAVPTLPTWVPYLYLSIIESIIDTRESEHSLTRFGCAPQGLDDGDVAGGFLYMVLDCLTSKDSLFSPGPDAGGMRVASSRAVRARKISGVGTDGRDLWRLGRVERGISCPGGQKYRIQHPDTTGFQKCVLEGTPADFRQAPESLSNTEQEHTTLQHWPRPVPATETAIYVAWHSLYIATTFVFKMALSACYTRCLLCVRTHLAPREHTAESLRLSAAEQGGQSAVRQIRGVEPRQLRRTGGIEESHPCQSIVQYLVLVSATMLLLSDDARGRFSVVSRKS
ncbi:hypothetical protein B2J93_7439 [Marssonina coronariae]|uniref:Uncharacterized protein n=1 Tax=Diplocarpon coronariae TaxID=2795749 RepID=A0A218Z5Q8_9HELO|nr:hypothetical protein B2J93_7439 [Marssonina coronariae]